MKRLSIFLIAASIIAAFECGGGKNSSDVNTMTMTANAQRLHILLGGKGTATIDWGYGRDNRDTKELVYDEFATTANFQRLRTTHNSLTITITGDNVEYFDCRLLQLSDLDVSLNPALKVLWCGWNDLTALDASQKHCSAKNNCCEQ